MLVTVNSSRRFDILTWVPAPVLTACFAALLFGAFLLLKGQNPFVILWSIFQGAFLDGYGLKETLTRSTPLLFCALASAIPARAGLFNIGAEGQLHAGAIAATAVALHSGALSSPTTITLMFVAAMIAGALWGLVPAFLRARWDVNEVLVTLMLNYVAIYLVQYLVSGPWKDPSASGWPYSAAFPDNAILPTWAESNVHIGLVFAVFAAFLFYFFLRKTTWGFAIRVIEASPATAGYSGINLSTYIIVLMALGGALAAMAGVGEVSVIQGRLRPGISPGYGYTGFLISCLARHNPMLILPVTLLIGGLYSGADVLQLEADLPGATINIFMGMVFLSFLVSNYFQDRTNKRIARKT